MKTDNILRFMSMLFGAYSFIATLLITYIAIQRGSLLSPLEISGLVSATIAILIGIIADFISLQKEDRFSEKP